MDFISALTEYGPAVIALAATLAAAAWAALRIIAPLTKTDADDKFIEEHGDAIEKVIKDLEDRP